MVGRSLFVGAALYGLLGAIWGSIYLTLGLTIPALVPYSYVVFAVIVLVFYRVTGRFVISRTAILLAWLVLPLVLQVTLGGFTSGGAVVLWSLAAPIGSLFVAPRESVVWTVGFLAILVVAWMAESWLQPADGVTPDMIRTFFAMNLAGVGVAVFLIVRDFLRRLQSARADLALEKDRSDTLLLNVLPAPIAERLKGGEETIADRLDEVTVVFADIVGFTPMSEGMAANEIVDLLDGLVAEFDRLVEAHEVEKIRTAGDGYMAIAGAPEPSADHVARAAELALDMLEAAHHHTDSAGRTLELRVGIDCGPVIAGVIGLKKFTYDVWGVPVNTASRMESHGVPGRIQVTQAVRDRLGDSFQFEARGMIDVKGKGPMSTYFLLGRRLAPTPVENLRKPPSLPRG